MMQTGDTTKDAAAGRGHPRKADGARRAALPEWSPKAWKRGRGRTDGRTPPAHIRAFGVELDTDDRSYIRRKLGMKLGKLASSIERVSVRVDDVNGPRGGIDHVCRVKVVLSGLPSVVVAERDASLRAAIDRTLGGAERATRRALQRRRTKPLKDQSKARQRGSPR